MTRLMMSAAAAGALLMCSGCFVVQVERPVATGHKVYLRQNFFLLGRIGEWEIDVPKECPQGVGTFGDRFTFGDALIGLLTVGIYTPRTVVIECAQKEMG